MFALFFLVAFFILVRFLIVQNKCKRRPMVAFYSFSIVVLLFKSTKYALSTQYRACSDIILYLHFLSLNAFLVVGIIHSYNLMKLISDLKTIDAKERLDFKAMRCAFAIRRLVTWLWGVVVITILVFMCLSKTELVLFMDTVVYSILASKLLYLNFSLLKTIRRMFGQNYAEDNFRQERRFLMVTVFCFSVAYILLAIQSMIGTIFLYDNNQRVKEIICDQGIKSKVFNLVNVLFVDQIPFAAIFTLHWINFRKETTKQALVELE